MNLTALVPLRFRILALVVLVLALVGYGWVKGAEHADAKWDKLNVQREKKEMEVAGKRRSITEAIALKYMPQLQKIKVVTVKQIEQVNTFVPVGDCPMSPGFRVFHDAAAAGQLPDPARIADAAAVSADTVANTVAENYGTCLETAKRLEGLQEWVRKQKELNRAP